MKKTTTILAVMAFGLTLASAGEPAPAPSGKGVSPPPPPPDPCAVPISYSNLELLYAATDFGGPIDDSVDGAELHLEYSSWSNFYLTLSATYADVGGGDIWTISGGLGVYFPITPNFHVAIDGGVFQWNAEYDYFVQINPNPNNLPPTRVEVDADDTGWYVRPHLRAKFGCFETHAGVTYREIDDAEEWNFFIKLYYQLGPNWDITVGYNEWDDSEAETWTLGARYRF